MATVRRVLALARYSLANDSKRASVSRSISHCWHDRAPRSANSSISQVTTCRPPWQWISNHGSGADFNTAATTSSANWWPTRPNITVPASGHSSDNCRFEEGWNNSRKIGHAIGPRMARVAIAPVPAGVRQLIRVGWFMEVLRPRFESLRESTLAGHDIEIN